MGRRVVCAIYVFTAKEFGLYLVWFPVSSVLYDSGGGENSHTRCMVFFRLSHTKEQMQFK